MSAQSIERRGQPIQPGATFYAHHTDLIAKAVTEARARSTPPVTPNASPSAT
jgi:hypothetical protein